ncbi:hypothetical protein ABQG65_08725 [Yersinia alsatica]|uniref:hypothetical protein n=1 Tax=Yersinia alsatica TaxID=2890317 RepID=UPI0032EEBD79
MATAIISVVILYIYWYSCRSSALREKENLADITIAYLKDEKSPGTLKDIVYYAFIGADRFWFFPLICLLYPFIFLFINEKITSKSDEIISNSDSIKFQDVINLVVAVNIKRHPITSMLFASLAVLLSTITISLRIVFGGLKKIPNFSASVITTAKLINVLRNKLHA